jgi:hypothetical protein
MSKVRTNATSTVRSPGRNPTMAAISCSAIALGLLFLFGISVFSQLFPLRLLSPTWLLRISGVLIERAPLALLGLGMLQLAAYLDPSNPRLKDRWHKLGRRGVVAVMGFLLLIPLQLVAAGRTIQGIKHSQRLQEQRVEQNLNLMRQQIQAATSFDDLQRRIHQIQAPDLVVGPDALNKSLPAFKDSLLASVDQSQTQLRRPPRLEASTRTWTVVEKSSRGLVSALVLALSFAAATPMWSEPEDLLLMNWRRKWDWGNVWRNRLGKGKGKGKAAAAISDEEYVRRLIDDQPLK